MDEAALVVAAAAPLEPFAGELEEEAQRAQGFAAAQYAGNTRKAYDRQWRAWCTWCSERHLRPLPSSRTAPAGPVGAPAGHCSASPCAPATDGSCRCFCAPCAWRTALATVCLYLSWLARAHKPATIDQALAAICEGFKLAGYPSPRGDGQVKAVRQGIRKTLGTAQRQKAPLLAAELRAAAPGAGPRRQRGTELGALRDWLLLLLGWYGSLRRSELVAIEVADVRFLQSGLEVLIRRSKTDQEGRGRVIPYPRARREELCPDRVLRGWLAATGITEGPILRSVSRWGRVGLGRLSGQAVAEVVKAIAAASGLDPADFAGHSLRAGGITEMARAGRAEHEIMKISGHVSHAMVQRYIRDADRWRAPPNRDLLEGA